MASWRHEPPRVRARGTYYRQVEPPYPPLWHPGPASDPARQPPARWHSAGQLAQYLSSDADGAWAELVRYEHIRTDADRFSEPRRLYACAIDEHDLADLSDFDLVLGLGLDPELLVDDDHARTRILADDLRSASFRGVLAPSAALPGVINLTLFDGRREIRHDDPHLLTARNPRPDYWIPAQPLVDQGIVPVGILPRTRLLGDAHLAYERWTRARP